MPQTAQVRETCACGAGRVLPPIPALSPTLVRGLLQHHSPGSACFAFPDVKSTFPPITGPHLLGGEPGHLALEGGLEAGRNAPSEPPRFRRLPSCGNPGSVLEATGRREGAGLVQMMISALAGGLLQGDVADRATTAPVDRLDQRLRRCPHSCIFPSSAPGPGTWPVGWAPRPRSWRSRRERFGPTRPGVSQGPAGPSCQEALPGSRGGDITTVGCSLASPPAPPPEATPAEQSGGAPGTVPALGSEVRCSSCARSSSSSPRSSAPRRHQHLGPVSTEYNLPGLRQVGGEPSQAPPF